MDLRLLTLAVLVASAAPQDDGGPPSSFEPPVRLVADGRFVNRGGNVQLPAASYFDIDEDGRRELVVSDEWGFVRVYENRAEDGEPKFGPSTQPRVGDANLQFPNYGATGIHPQLVDLDGDGRLDLLVGTAEGTVLVARRGDDGFLPVERVRDHAGRPVQLARSYDAANRRWLDRDGVPAVQSTPEEHSVAASAVDWDGDGDLDLLLASAEGTLFLRRNEGSRTAYRYASANDAVMTHTSRGIRPLRVPNGITSTRAVDWDGDGLFDLICGSNDGGVLLFRNTGEKGQPYFGRPTALVQDWNATRDQPGAEPTAPERRHFADPVDIDGDGDLDLLVSGVSRVTPLPRELTEEEALVADELERRERALEESIRDVYREAARRDAPALDADQEKRVGDYRRDLGEVRAKLQEYRPRAVDVGYVWLYRRR